MALTAGCGATIGSAPGDPPPNLAFDGESTVWQNISSFGPVPPELAPQGEAACGGFVGPNGETYQALGYHPNAIGANGLPIPGGGFFCVPK